MAIEIKDGFEEEAENAAVDMAETEEAAEEILTEDAEEVSEEADTDAPEEDPEAPETAEEAPQPENPDTDTDADEAQAETETGETGDMGKAEKKSLFGKKKEKKDKRDEKIEELTDLLKRNMAEFDNFRKRTEKEKAAMYEVGARSIIEKLLPVVDNFERGLATVSEEDKEKDSFANGMDLVYKQILKLFEDLDVQVIETEGKEFDPNLHNAVMHIEDENLGENVIAQEFQKGYTYRGTVIRHSMVQVAN
jgi:molecular chaperone GrpE